MKIRRAKDRGRANFGWLDSRHTFSFGHYHDPAHMGFGPLRVINEDRVAPGGGFAEHGHQDMEIISYVLDGALEHKDSIGTGSVIRPGDVQRMSAGTGIRHSEFNASDSDPVHFLQIWIVPNKAGIAPGYEQAHFDEAQRKGKLRLVASPDGADGSLILHQDVRLFSSILDAGERVVYDIEANRGGWLQVALGQVLVNDQRLGAGDGAAFDVAGTVDIQGDDKSEILLFDIGPTHA
jgi:redox-sensitive bicupin YhaK (pirin superfamily)